MRQVKNLFIFNFDMKKFLKTIALFALLFYIVDKVAYFVLIKTTALHSDKKLEKIIEVGMDKELLVLGSSRGVGNIDVGQLEQQTRLSSYNISFRGSDIIFQEFMLELYLEYNDAPKMLLLIIDNPYMFEEGGSLKFRSDKLFPFANYEFINDKLIDLGNHSIASKYIYSLRLHSSQLRFGKSRNNYSWEMDIFGTKLVYGKSKSFDSYQKVSMEKYDLKESIEKVKAFKNIIAICKENNIDIHYIFPPNYHSFNVKFYHRFLKELGPNPFVFVYNKEESAYNNQEFFYDESHLNAKGAQVFTSELSGYLNTLKD